MPLRLPRTAVFKFFPASTWTGIIPFRSYRLNNLVLLIPYPGHYICRGSLIFKLFRHIFHKGFNIMEEHLVTLAKIVQSRLAIGGVNKPVFRTFAMTGIPDVALQTKTRQLVALVNSKVKLTLRFHHVN